MESLKLNWEKLIRANPRKHLDLKTAASELSFEWFIVLAYLQKLLGAQTDHAVACGTG